ncbi:unnamed protein product [Ambrosiozyma monospora]|uniref:Unnamed protein product n=1 Tax=Ambrosiozyma monospora TaxID=43982 RepID=A0A9W6YYG6_AMBMO|nr:unnamed protein product [Ambrosiozyma monospora]
MSTTRDNSGTTAQVHGSIFNRLISAFSSEDPSNTNTNTHNTSLFTHLTGTGNSDDMNTLKSQSQSYYSDPIKTILSITQPLLRHTNPASSSRSQQPQLQPQSQSQSQEPPKRQITLAEVRKHTAKDDLWMVIRGKVYDVTSLIDSHPGGAEVLFDCAGVDATSSFDDVSHSEYATEMLDPLYVGDCVKVKPEHKQHRRFLSSGSGIGSGLVSDEDSSSGSGSRLVAGSKAGVVASIGLSSTTRSVSMNTTTSVGSVNEFTVASMSDSDLLNGGCSSLGKKKKKVLRKKLKLRNGSNNLRRSKLQRQHQLIDESFNGGAVDAPLILRGSSPLLLIFTLIGLFLFLYLQRMKWSNWVV